jgi:hypothetical protein
MLVSAVKGYVTYRFLYYRETSLPNRLLEAWWPIYKQRKPGNAGRIVYGLCKVKINALSIVTWYVGGVLVIELYCRLHNCGAGIA